MEFVSVVNVLMGHSSQASLLLALRKDPFGQTARMHFIQNKDRGKIVSNWPSTFFSLSLLAVLICTFDSKFGQSELLLEF